MLDSLTFPPTVSDADYLPGPHRRTTALVADLFPLGSALKLAPDLTLDVILIGQGFETAADAQVRSILPPSVAILLEGVAKVHQEYLGYIAPETSLDRAEGYLLEDHDLTLKEAAKIYRGEGLYPFLLPELLVINLNCQSTSWDFDCAFDEYFAEYQFGLDLTPAGAFYAINRLAHIADEHYPLPQNAE